MMKRTISILLCAVLVCALFGCSKKVEPETTAPTTTTETTTEPVFTGNPLTGSEKFNPKAVGKRPVAIVVENLSPARPQWAIGSSDIIVEGEVEGGISRMLWLYADYTKVPEKVGPIRSARPSYVKFSQLFDSIFIHWGGSHNNGNYRGGYGVISKDKVNHLDGMSGGELFGRDTTRYVSVEHRGILHGDKIPAAIKKAGFRKKLKEKKFTRLSFAEALTDPAGGSDATTVNCTFSSRTDTRKFTYSQKDKKYHTQDWKTDVAFKNLVVLMDKTTYITVPYKGGSTTYLNYALKGGTAYYVSNGKCSVVKWSVTDGKLSLTDSNNNPVELNKGKSYIGLASSNHEGKVSYK